MILHANTSILRVAIILWCRLLYSTHKHLMN